MEFMLTLRAKGIDCIHSFIQIFFTKEEENKTILWWWIELKMFVCVSVHVNWQQNDKLKLKLPVIYRKLWNGLFLLKRNKKIHVWIGWWTELYHLKPLMDSVFLEMPHTNTLAFYKIMNRVFEFRRYINTSYFRYSFCSTDTRWHSICMFRIFWILEYGNCPKHISSFREVDSCDVISWTRCHHALVENLINGILMGVL